MIIKTKIIFSLAAMLLIIFQMTALAEEAKLLIAPIEVQTGQSFVVSVTIDRVEKLAGVKLSLQYDENVLIYEKSEKTIPLMQVVNDKEPGKLIIVMAGAKGISGKKMELLSLHFKTAASLEEKIVTKIQMIGIELVSDQLKAIPCKLSEGEITLLPEIN